MADSEMMQMIYTLIITHGMLFMGQVSTTDAEGVS